jgi:hypothetical protein
VARPGARDMTPVQMVHGSCVVFEQVEARHLLAAKRGTHVLSCFEPDPAGFAETVIVLDRHGRVLCSIRLDGNERVIADDCPKSVLPGIP